MNHYGLFIKLMKRRISDNLLLLLESWFAIGMTCVKWHNVWSRWFRLSYGIRQGMVLWLLSPYLFAIYIDSLVKKVQACGYGCYLRHTCISIIFYADDVLLLAPSVSSLQLILSVCVKEFHRLDKCSNIIASDSKIISWSNTIRYLGVNIVAGHKFACSLDNVARRVHYTRRLFS